MLGSRWEGELRGGLPLETHACNYWLQVGALNTTSTVSFGQLPDPSRNSSLPDTHSLSGLPYLLSSAGLLCSPRNPPTPFFQTIIRKHSFMSCFLLCHLLSAFLLMLFAVPAHGLGSLPNDEGGVSGAMHRLAGERDWMLGAGLVQSDNCGGTRAVRWTLTQALQQSKHWPLV